MRTSEHFELNLVEGNDLVNPLTQDVPNYEKIDEQMFKNESAGVGNATELKTSTIHALTRLNGNNSVFKFTATSRYEYGDTFTVDGVSVTAVAPNGTALADGCYIVGGTVLCSLVGQLLTIYTIGKATDSERLGGELPSYYATDSDLEQTSTLVQLTSTIANKNAEDIVELNNNITDIEGIISALQSGKVPFVDKGLDDVPELGFGGGWDGTQYYCTWCFYSSGERSRFAFQFKRPKESNTFYIRSWLWSNGWGEWKQIG